MNTGPTDLGTARPWQEAQSLIGVGSQKINHIGKFVELIDWGKLVNFTQIFSLQTIRMGADLVEMLRDVIFYLGLMSPACFEDLVLGLNFSNVACIKVLFFTFQCRVWWSPNQMAVSKGLGLGIVVGSSLVKLPQVGHHHWSTSFKSWKPCLVICARQHLCQVVKIGKSGSAEGISLTGTLLELAAITVSGAYNFSQGFPFRWYFQPKTTKWHLHLAVPMGSLSSWLPRLQPLGSWS